MLSSTASLLLLSFLPGVLASYDYDGDGVTSAFLGVKSTFALVFAIGTLLTFIGFFNLLPRIRNRGAAFALIPLILFFIFLLIGFVADVAYILCAYNTSGSPIASTAVTEILYLFFTHLAPPFLFLSLILILRNRLVDIENESGKKRSTTFRVVWSACLTQMLLSLVFSIISGALQARQCYILSYAPQTTSSRAYKNLQEAANGLYWTMIAFWIFSGTGLTALTLHVYKAMRHASMNDRVTNLMTFWILPLYICYLLFQLAFNIVLNPPTVEHLSNSTLNGVFLANPILTNLFATVIGFTLAICSQRSLIWTVKITDEESTSVKCQAKNVRPLRTEVPEKPKKPTPPSPEKVSISLEQSQLYVPISW